MAIADAFTEEQIFDLPSESNIEEASEQMTKPASSAGSSICVTKVTMHSAYRVWLLQCDRGLTKNGSIVQEGQTYFLYKLRLCRLRLSSSGQEPKHITS
jgi:hypothetical protein